MGPRDWQAAPYWDGESSHRKRATGFGLRGGYRTVAVVIALVVAANLLGFRHGQGSSTHRDRSDPELVRPERPPQNQGQWSFRAKDDDGRPIAYDPCRTIPYVVHVGRGPLNGVILVQEGIARLEKATGLRFRYDGMTDRIPSADDRSRAGAPVWIGWATDDETDKWNQVGDAIGLGGSSIQTRPDGSRVYVTGVVALRPTGAVTGGFAYGESTGGVLLHELGHLVGLNHVDDQRQVMHGGIMATTPENYGPGDLAGLYELGAARGCH